MGEKYNYSSKEEANGGIATTAHGETFAEQYADHDVFGHEENNQVRLLRLFPMLIWQLLADTMIDPIQDPIMAARRRLDDSGNRFQWHAVLTLFPRRRRDHSRRHHHRFLGHVCSLHQLAPHPV